MGLLSVDPSIIIDINVLPKGMAIVFGNGRLI
jgi:hypothetical protein